MKLITYICNFFIFDSLFKVEEEGKPCCTRVMWFSPLVNCCLTLSVLRSFTISISFSVLLISRWQYVKIVIHVHVCVKTISLLSELVHDNMMLFFCFWNQRFLLAFEWQSVQIEIIVDFLKKKSKVHIIMWFSVNCSIDVKSFQIFWWFLALEKWKFLCLENKFYWNHGRLPHCKFYLRKCNAS